MRRFARTVLALSFVTSVTPLLGTQRVITPDWGIVCLDETTGVPLWELFPDEIGYFDMAIADGRLIVTHRGSPIIGPQGTFEGVTDGYSTQLDLNTGQPFDTPEPVPCEEVVQQHGRWPRPMTASGNLVVADPGNSRAITILKGEGPDVLRVIPTGAYYRSWVVNGDVVAYCSNQSPFGSAITEKVIAIDTNTGETLWTIKDKAEAKGLSGGENQIYVLEHEAIRAVDPTLGRVLWRQKLPRSQGYARVNEYNGRAYVHCDARGLDSGHPMLYCLDVATGAVRWTYDPQRPFLRLPLLFHNGRIYTYVGPSRIASALASSSGCPRETPRVRSYERRPRKPPCLEFRFAEKTSEEIELNLRAWHALGDRALIPALQDAERIFAGTPRADLARQLIETFPLVRDRMAILNFLSVEFDKERALGPEIRRILEDYNPIPFWMDDSRVDGMSGRPLPELEPTDEERVLVKTFRKLKARVEAVPVERLTRTAIAELMFKKGSASFDSILAAHEARTDPDERLLLRMALYAQHARRGSDWALERLDHMDEAEITQWVQYAPLDWLVEHHEAYESLLAHENGGVRSSSARRLTRSDSDQSMAVSYCVARLQRNLSRITDRDLEVIQACLGILGNSGDSAHADLVRRYALGVRVVEVSEPAIPDVETIGRRIYGAAASALKSLGVNVPPRPTYAVPLVEPPLPPVAGRDPCDVASGLEQRIASATWDDRPEDAKNHARQIIEVLRDYGPPEDGPVRYDHCPEEYLALAYDTLGEWERAIKYAVIARANGADFQEDRLVRLYDKTKRFDELEALAMETLQPYRDISVAAGFALIRHEQYRRATIVFERMLSQWPNSADACIGMALIAREQAELDRSDRWMERAIALRPSPGFSDNFGDTITHWLKRGQPEKARAWLRESVRIDRGTWEREGCFDWAEQFEELKATVEALRLESAALSTPKIVGE